MCFGIGRKREKKFEKLQFLQLMQNCDDPSADSENPDGSELGSFENQKSKIGDPISDPTKPSWIRGIG